MLLSIQEQTPRLFELPKYLRERFDNVWTHPGTGDYIDTLEYEIAPVKSLRSLNASNNDLRSSTPVCFKCNKSGTKLTETNLLNSHCIQSNSRNPRSSKSALIKCDYCGMNWHLDCLDPPLSNLPAEITQEKEIVDVGAMSRLRKRAWGVSDAVNSSYDQDNPNEDRLIVQLRRKWMCPCHIQKNVKKRRKLRKCKTVDFDDETVFLFLYRMM